MHTVRQLEFMFGPVFKVNETFIDKNVFMSAHWRQPQPEAFWGCPSVHTFYLLKKISQEHLEELFAYFFFKIWNLHSLFKNVLCSVFCDDYIEGHELKRAGLPYTASASGVWTFPQIIRSCCSKVKFTETLEIFTQRFHTYYDLSYPKGQRSASQ